MLGFIGRHKIAFGVGALILFLFFYLGSGSGSSSSGGTVVPGQSDADYQASLAANTQLATLQAQSDAASAQANYALQGQSAQIAGAEALAGLQGQYQYQGQQLAAGVATQQIAASQESTDLSNTLQEQLGQAQLATQEQIAALGAGIEGAQIQATVNMNAQNVQALEQVTQTQANQAVQLGQIASSTYENLNAQNQATLRYNIKKNTSWWGSIFG